MKINIKNTMALILFPVCVFASTYRFSFAFFSDPQWGWSAPGQTIITQDSLETEEIVSAINTGIGGKTASFTLIGGDVVNAKNGNLYRNTKVVFDKLSNPYYLQQGNHDSLDSLKALFSFPPFTDKQGSDSAYYFIQNEWMIIGFNFVNQSDENHPRAISLDTLNSYLNIDASKYKIIFSHHNIPQSFYLAENNMNHAAITSAIEAEGNVKIVLCGHLTQCLGRISSGVNYLVSLQVHMKPNYEWWWFDCYDDGTFVKTFIKGS